MRHRLPHWRRQRLVEHREDALQPCPDLAEQVVEHGDQEVPALAPAPVRTPTEHLAAPDDERIDVAHNPAHGHRSLKIAKCTVVAEVDLCRVVVQRPHARHVVVDHAAARLEHGTRIPLHTGSLRGRVGTRVDAADQLFRDASHLARQVRLGLEGGSV